ncbi:hypothetical protein PV728_47460 [Streptomyces europaeiscabiei]|uniref:hypothetical protein n=1 Tax=Streptomyces europaeiscabiei TaxID=146819 RepID=UPI0029A54849|nr:hypothetical protein [Streptomyces europaeiscabiei]MDX3637688.1 hypothetical protein [Streptomyces europaeiscabiei]MDX3655519.1 hypothetical protein [Streptomyces europaeiscabiei]
MTKRSAKISLTEVGSGVIEVDGQRIRGVRSLKLESEAGDRPVLTLELVVHDVSTMAEALVLIDDQTAATLVALGWTPPPEQEVSG